MPGNSVLMKASFELVRSAYIFLQDVGRFARNTFESKNRWICAAFLLTLLSGTIVRIYYLWHPIRYDEALTRVIAYQSLGKVVTEYFAPNNHLLHSIMVKCSSRIWGDTLVGLRFPAFIAGILLIIVVFVFASILYDREVGLIASVLTAFSSSLVEYSVLARGYTILLVLFLLAFTLGAYLLRTNNGFAWIMFAFVSVFGFYTIPTMLYPLGVVVVWLIVSVIFEKEKKINPLSFFKRLFVSLTTAGIMTSLLYLPLILNGSYKMAFTQPESRRLPWDEFFSNLSRTAKLTWSMWMRDIPFFLAVLLLCFFLISILSHPRVSSYRIHPFFPAVLWLVPLIFALRVISPLMVRAWLFLLPIFLCCAAAGVVFLIRSLRLSILRTRIVMIICALALIVSLPVFLLHFNGISYSEEGGRCNEAEDIVIFLKGMLREGDRILSCCPCDLTIAYYAEKYAIPKEHLYGNILLGKRVIFVVNRVPVYSQSIKSVLDYGNIDYEKVRRTIRLINRFECTDIYECYLR